MGLGKQQKINRSSDMSARKPVKKNPSDHMTRREFLSAGAASALLFPSLLRAGSRGSRPDGSGLKNIVFIISDQHRFDFGGFAGHPIVATPNLDRMAREGTVFENMYCQYPLCVPSRTSIVRSQYAGTHGIRTNDVPSMDTLVNHLGNQGYRTWLFGKSHMAVQAFDTMIDRNNLDRYVDAEISGAQDAADKWYSQQYKGLIEDSKGINTKYLLYPLQEAWHEESLFYELADKTLRQNKETPFFLWISYKSPHPAWTPPEIDWNKYLGKDLPVPPPVTPELLQSLPLYKQKDYANRQLAKMTQEDRMNAARAYCAYVEYTDRMVGKVLNLLDALNLSQDTLVVYTADHGEMLGEHGLYHKMAFYEPSAHIPGILRCPGLVPAGRRIKKNTQHIDLMPTLFELAGIPLQGMEQGRSMVNLIKDPNDPSWDDEAYCEVLDHYVMIRKGKWKYNCFPASRTYPDDRDQLFDLEADPGETINLVDDLETRDVRSDLLARIAARFPISTGVNNHEPKQPGDFLLEQNYPNPFNPRTTVRFTLPRTEHATLVVVDARGREVATLTDRILPPGGHHAVFNAEGLPSGPYFFRLTAGDTRQIREGMLIK